MKVPLTDLLIQASSPHCVVSNLLWRTRQAAREWGDEALEQWAAQELAGYGPETPLPDARRPHARLWSRLPQGTWTLHRLAPGQPESLLEVACREPVAVLEEQLRHCHLWLPLPLDAYELLELQPAQGPALEFNRYLPRGAVEALLRQDRQRVRHWAYRRLNGLRDEARTSPIRHATRTATWASWFARWWRRERPAA